MPEDAVQDAPLATAWIERTVSAALDEDMGGSPGIDVTTQATIDATATGQARIVMREPGVVAGTDLIRAVTDAVSLRLGLPACVVSVVVDDGDVLAEGDVVATLRGSLQVILIAERTVLNLLSRAAGVATHTRRWVDALAGTHTRIVDTRKTTPTLRELDKYAVRCGGGTNKRFGLFDCAMIKDNHVAAVGSVAAAIAAVRDGAPDTPIQVEIDREDQAWEALEAGARFLMLDNMEPDRMTALVAQIREAEPTYGAVRMEATGGVTLERAAAIAATGVDFVSVGALTHSSPIVDIALDLT